MREGGSEGVKYYQKNKVMVLFDDTRVKVRLTSCWLRPMSVYH